MDGLVLQIRRTKDKSYLYTCNPSPIHHASNKINHCLKIVDYFIENGSPEKFLIEPVLGSYEPDIFLIENEKSICIELQITPISNNKMQMKYDAFVKEYGREHDSQIFVICSDYSYSKKKTVKGFKVVKKRLPLEKEY
jgi:hypothetical protein